MSGKKTVILHGPSQREYAHHLVDKAAKGVVLEFSEPKRSIDQNLKMWALLTEVADAQPEGRQWTPETWKFAFMHALGHQVRFCESLDGASPFPVGFKSSNLNKQQMSELIECIYEYGTRHQVKFKDQPDNTSGQAESSDGDPSSSQPSEEPNTQDAADSPAQSLQGEAGETPSGEASANLADPEGTNSEPSVDDVREGKNTPSVAKDGDLPSLNAEQTERLQSFWKDMIGKVEKPSPTDGIEEIQNRMFGSVGVWKSDFIRLDIEEQARVVYAAARDHLKFLHQLKDGISRDEAIARIKERAGVEVE